MNIEHLLPVIREHAASDAPRECCGLIVRVCDRLRYLPCRNMAVSSEHFVIHPADYAEAEDTGDIVMVVHSHINIPALPSDADRAGIEQTNLPWLIVNHPTGAWTITEPSGYIVPLEGREFVHGVHDCYSLVRDYYWQQLGLTLPDFERMPEWWLHGENLYRENFGAAGFIEVPFDQMSEHDVLLMQVRSLVENHAAVYVGGNVILQHLMDRLSGRQVYEAYWQKHTSAVLRHNSLL